MAVGDVLEVDILQDVAGQSCMNVLHYSVQADSTDPFDNEGALADLVGTELFVPLAAQMSEEWSVAGFYVHRVHPAPGIPFSNVFGLAEPIEGAIVSEAIPMTSALVVRKGTHVAGKSYRGRIYICGTPELAQNAGQLTTAAQLAFQSIFNGWEDELEEDGGTAVFAPIVWSRTLDNVGTDIYKFTVMPNLGTIRSRRSAQKLSDA